MTAESPSSTVRRIVRPAAMEDAVAIAGIVNQWASLGRMLFRRVEEVERSIRDFVVLQDDGVVSGCGALALYGADLAEVRSLAVLPQMQRGGGGAAIVRHLLAAAAQLGVQRVFAFTYVPAFFEKLGFDVVPPETLPQKAWRDCIHCPKRTNCDEIAVLHLLPSTVRS